MRPPPLPRPERYVIVPPGLHRAAARHRWRRWRSSTAVSLPVTSSMYSCPSSQTWRTVARVTRRPVSWPVIWRLRAPSRWSIAAATAASTRACSPCAAIGVKAVGKLLGDEAGRELASLPARMRHQGCEKRDVVANARDRELVERARLRRNRDVAGLGMRHELGDHRVVIERDLAALADAGVVPHRDAVVDALGRRPIRDQPADRRQVIAIRILRIDSALDRPAGELHIALLECESFSPAATRVICSTRSMPVTSSVTGCSTCSRVFISRK